MAAVGMDVVGTGVMKMMMTIDGEFNRSSPRLIAVYPKAFGSRWSCASVGSSAERFCSALPMSNPKKAECLPRCAAAGAYLRFRHFGANTKVFDPRGLPMAASVPADHPKVTELRALSAWSEGQVWCSPERHGTLTAVFTNRIDWLPLEFGGVRPTQGRTLAIMQVCGGSQSLNAADALRVLGRWMRMVTIRNQSPVPKAYTEFDADGRMKPSPYYDRVVDVMEELYKFTLLVRDRSGPFEYA